MSLRIEKIHKGYPDFQLDLDLVVRQGEFLVLLGPSGCGKTTTLRLLGGFVEPDSGSLHIDGKRVDTVPAHRRRIGLVFQDYALFPHLNVRDNIAFGLRMQGWEDRAIKTRVEELLRLVSLEGYGRRKISLLSGGEQQRVALARALAPRPSLLLLDEPLSALDARLRKDLRTEIKRIQRELGVTTIYVTHDQEEALVLGDRIAVMRNGRIEQIDAPEAMYNKPSNLFVAGFLGQANLLRGRVTGWDADLAEVETAVGELRVSSTPRRGNNPGDEVLLFFRPEHCDLSDSVVNRFSGQVVHREYLGSHYVFEVETAENLRFTLSLLRPPRESTDGIIHFSVDPGSILLFKPDS